MTAKVQPRRSARSRRRRGQATGWYTRILAGLVPATALAVWPPAHDDYAPVKLTVLAVLVALLAWRRPPAGEPLTAAGRVVKAAAATLLATATISGVAGGAPAASLFGAEGRAHGILLYAILTALAWVLSGHVPDGAVDTVLRWWAGAAVAVSAFALLEAATGPLLAGETLVSGAHVTFSNPNFLGGWLACAAGPVALSAWRWRAGDTRGRLAVAAAAVLLLTAGVAASRSLLGMLGLGAAGLTLAALLVAQARPGMRRTVLGGYGLLAALGGGLVAAGVAGAGPLATLAEQTGVRLRRFYWDAALQMASDRPLTGVGFDRFESAYRGARSPEAAGSVDLLVGADAAHNVPLHLLATGGALTVVAYLVLVGATAWLLVRRLRSSDGQTHRLYAGLAATWVAYLVQSLGSFDVVPLATVHWLVIGLLVAEPATTPSRTSRKGAPRVARSSVVLRVFAVVLAGLAVLPLLSSTVHGAADRQAEGGNVAALDTYGTAASIGFWRTSPLNAQASVHAQLGQDQAALAAYDRVLARDGRDFSATLGRARTLDGMDGPAAAVEAYQAALALDPWHPDLLREAALVHLEAGDLDTSAELVGRALQVRPDFPEALRVQEAISEVRAGEAQVGEAQVGEDGS